MLQKWKTYQAKEVLTGNDENGNRLLSLFARDYKIITKSELCSSCNNFTEKFNQFIEKLENMKNIENKNSVFQLNPMYDNIPLDFGSQIYVSNENLTNELALQLLVNHPLGKELFSVLPENLDNLKKEDGSKKDNENIDLFGKEFSINDAKDLFKSAGIETKATTVKGLENSLEKITQEQMLTLELLITPDTLTHEVDPSLDPSKLNSKL